MMSRKTNMRINRSDDKQDEQVDGQECDEQEQQWLGMMVMKSWSGATMPQPTTCKKCQEKKQNSKRRKKEGEEKRHEMQQCKL